MKFLEFLASDAAQRKFAEGNYEYPAVVDIKVSPVLMEFGPYKTDSLNASKLGSNNKKAVRTMDRAGWR